MSRHGTFDWISLSVLLLLMCWWYFVQLRFLLQRSRSKSWPSVEAKLQKGAVGRISFGKGASAPAAFVGYAYSVDGVRYAGFFALYGDDKVGRLNDALAGGSVQVHYKPTDPNVSYLMNRDDSRFEGLSATQNPEWLEQSQAFDLQNAIR
jgi:hypothetical protein